jgi:hypothetical protein
LDPTNRYKEHAVLKKIGFVTAATAAGLIMMGGIASADAGGSADEPAEGYDQVGLLNLNNTDVLHNVNAVLGVCDNNINVLGVQVPVEDIANGVALPILSPGDPAAAGETPDPCASGGIVDGGTEQDN